MGRVKLEIKKLEHSSSRQVTYSKRKQGLAKKASELATLCDTDVALIMFSPTGRPFQIPRMEDSKLEHVILRFANLSEQEREKRKQESVEILNKIIKSYSNSPVLANEDKGKSEDIIEAANRSKNMSDSLYMYQEELRRLQFECSCLQQKLRSYQGEDLGSVLRMDEISFLEEKLEEALGRISARKEIMSNNFEGIMQGFQGGPYQLYGQIYPTAAQGHWLDRSRQLSQHDAVQESVYSTSHHHAKHLREERVSEEFPANTSFQAAYANQPNQQFSAPAAAQMLFDLSQNLEGHDRVHHPNPFMEGQLEFMKEKGLKLSTLSGFVEGDHMHKQAEPLGHDPNVGQWTCQSNQMGPFCNELFPKVSAPELDVRLARNMAPQFANSQDDKTMPVNIMHRYDRQAAKRSGHDSVLSSSYYGKPTSPMAAAESAITVPRTYGSIFPS